VGSKWALMTATPMDWREVLWRNSWVRKWLWRLAYEKGSALVTRLVTNSLNLPRRLRNTYKLKSCNETDRPAAANSSNNTFAFYINIMTESLPCRRSWKEPWNCIIWELDEEAKAGSKVCQTECEV
jgi:hypothetical protein